MFAPSFVRVLGSEMGIASAPFRCGLAVPLRQDWCMSNVYLSEIAVDAVWWIPNYLISGGLGKMKLEPVIAEGIFFHFCSPFPVSELNRWVRTTHRP